MNEQQRRFSIMMTVYDQAPDLRENLPVYLTQTYEPGYEVIVIDETSTDDTSDVLKLLKKDYPHLYTTFLPKPNRLIVRRKLAISIGAKAAKNEWLIIVNIHNRPQAPDVLQAINDNFDSDSEVTLGYNNRKGIRLQSFSTCDDVRQHILKAERRLRKVHERNKRMGYLLGRYDFIIIRKDSLYDLLKLFEQQLSGGRLLKARLSILAKNLSGRSATTQLYTE